MNNLIKLMPKPSVRVLNQDYSSRIPTLLDGAKKAETSLDKATVLNNHFYSCFNHKVPPLQQSPNLIENCFPPSDCPKEFLCTCRRDSLGAIVRT